MKLSLKLNQKGQTALEYMLMLAVAVTIGFAFKKKMEDFLLRNPNSFVTKSLKGLSQQFQSDTTGRYKYFSLR